VRWLELSCRVDAEAVEAVSEAFSRMASGGVAVEPDIVSGADDGFTLGTLATVRGYVPLDDAATGKTRKLDESLGHLHAIWPTGDLQVREIAEEDWAHAWKSHYSTFRVGERVVIRPSWQDYRATASDVVVSLDPGAAFGTGLHPTTRRCLELLEKVVRPGDRVLDVGTGSGILAIAAAGLGAGEVVAVDVDPLAARVAAANVKENGLGGLVHVVAATVTAVAGIPRFDVVVANIIARVIVEIAPELAARVKSSGMLIAAGVIAERAADVALALGAEGFAVDRYEDGDWIAFIATRRSDT